MKPPYFIETLARNGDMLSRHQVDALPIRLGRGYDNDCILDDAYVGERHAVIEAHGDGQLLLRDLGSRNGTISGARRHGSVILSGDTVVRLGHTSLRVRGSDHPVPKELADKANYGWEGARPALLGLALIAASAAFGYWLSDMEKFAAIHYLLVIAYGMAAGLVWSALWAFGNRLFGRHARLGRHLFILGCGLVAMEAWKIFSSVIAYAYSMVWLTRYGNHVLVALASGMIFFHLQTVLPHRSRPLAWTALCLMILGSGLNLIGNMQLAGRFADEPYMSVLLPPALRQSPDHSLDEFFGDVTRLKARVDAERDKTFQRAAPDNDEQE
jgi:hypothetical protein